MPPAAAPRFLLLSLAVLAVTSPSAPGQAAQKLSYAEEAPAYNDIVARSFLIDVEPLIEKHTGWECEWPVPFRLVTRAQYVAIAANEIKTRLDDQYPAGTLDGMLKPILESKAVGLLGCYSASSKSLYLLPGNLKPVLRTLGVEDRHSRALIEVIIAHELTHAVQDARHRVTERAAMIGNEDEHTAWTMLVEGHASWVADRVADDLQLSEAAQRLAEKMVRPNVAPAWRGRSGNDTANFRGYTSGKKFVEEVFRRGGLKAVQRLFDAPPRTVAMIEEPALYFTTVEER